MPLIAGTESPTNASDAAALIASRLLNEAFDALLFIRLLSIEAATGGRNCKALHETAPLRISEIVCERLFALSLYIDLHILVYAVDVEAQSSHN